jgi:hypothetical protein
LIHPPSPPRGAKIESKDLIMEGFNKIILKNLFKVPYSEPVEEGGLRSKNIKE